MSEIPKIGAPATRALEAKGIKNLKQLARYTKQEIGALHGMGPKAIGILDSALAKNGLSFRNK